MNTETKVTTGATETTYDIDIELPPLPDSIFISDHQGDGEYFEAEDMQDYARAAIEADRKKFGRNDNDNRQCRGKPVAKIDPNPPQLSIVWHDSPESIDRAMWEQAAIEAGVSYEELIEGQNVGETEDGEVFEFTHEQAIDGMRTQGCWGFVDTKTNTINAWAADDVDAPTALHFLAHEIGHVTGEQLDDDMQEEMRAEQFGRVAALAYRMWCEKKNDASQPAESVSRDVEALVRLLEDGEWAEHVARTPLGQRLELAITTLVGEASKPHNEPVSKTDWNNELSSWGDEDFIHIFHERPDLANRLRKILAEPVKSTCKECNGTGVESTRFHGVWPNGEECLEPIKCDQCDGFGTTSAAEPVKCIGCEGKPAPENNPCAVCGKEAESVGGLSAGQLAEILTAYIKPEIIGEALEKLENAPWELSGPVKPHLTVKYDDKGDCLYICCDSNEPAEAEENDQGILFWRAYSDGRLVGVTIPNFIGPYIKPVKVDAEVSVPSDAELEKAWDSFEAEMARHPTDDELEEFMAQFADEMGHIHDDQHAEAARALLARYGQYT